MWRPNGQGVELLRGVQDRSEEHNILDHCSDIFEGQNVMFMTTVDSFNVGDVG